MRPNNAHTRMRGNNGTIIYAKNCKLIRPVGNDDIELSGIRSVSIILNEDDLNTNCANNVLNQTIDVIEKIKRGTFSRRNSFGKSIIMSRGGIKGLHKAVKKPKLEAIMIFDLCPLIISSEKSVSSINVRPREFL